MKISLTVLFSLYIFLVSAQPDCNRFKTGNYTLEGSSYLKIKRTRKYQYEYNTVENTESKYRVKWLSNCVYTLTLICSTDTSEVRRSMYNAPIRITITETNNDKYRYLMEVKVQFVKDGVPKLFEYKEDAGMIKLRD